MVSIVSLNRAGLFLLSKMVPRGPSHLKERQRAARKSWSEHEECLPRGPMALESHGIKIVLKH